MKSLKDLCWNLYYSTFLIVTHEEAERADKRKLFKAGKTGYRGLQKAFKILHVG